MPKFTYTDEAERIYPRILTDKGSLVARKGDVREFDAAPDIFWVQVPEAKAAKQSATADKEVK